MDDEDPLACEDAAGWEDAFDEDDELLPDVPVEAFAFFDATGTVVLNEERAKDMMRLR